MTVRSHHADSAATSADHRPPRRDCQDASVRLIHPEVRQDVAIEEAYGSMLGERGDRPWVAVCMIASLDGSTVVDGRSGPLGNETDAAVLRQLRATADVVLVGARTAAHENYGPPRKAGQRVGVVTASGRVDLDQPLFTSGAGFVITGDDTPIGNAGDTLPDIVRAGVDGVDLRRAIAAVDELCGYPGALLFEGGPTLNGVLLDAGLVDEWDLTTSSSAVGGDGPRPVAGAGDTEQPFELAQLAIDAESFLFARWRRRAT